MDFGSRIRMKRKAMGMTQADLAARCGVTTPQISKFENGMLPKRQNQGAIAKVKRVLKVRTGRKGIKRAAPVKAPTDLKAVLKELRSIRAELATLRESAMVVTVKEPGAIIAEKNNGEAVTHPTPAPAAIY